MTNDTMIGVGPLTALAVEAFAPPMESFECGRDFAALLASPRNSVQAAARDGSAASPRPGRGNCLYEGASCQEHQGVII